MSEKTELKKGEFITTKTKVFFAILPWAIIVLGIVALLSHVNGWNMRSADSARVTGEANAIVKQLSKASQ